MTPNELAKEAAIHIWDFAETPDDAQHIILTAIETSRKDLELENQQLSAAVKARDEALEQWPHDSGICLCAKHWQEHASSCPISKALSTTPPNALRELLAPTIELLQKRKRDYQIMFGKLSCDVDSETPYDNELTRLKELSK